jgi:hydroxyacylglutathione hydrolase
VQIHAIYTHSQLRNFTYFIVLDDRTVIVVDPWSDELVNAFLHDHRLSLNAIINTHEHWDHIQGNKALVAQHGCDVWAHANGAGKIPGLNRVLQRDEIIALNREFTLKVLDTPGHTYAHLCFLLQKNGQPHAVFTGDTLFNAGVGRCDSGDAETLYRTISEQFHSLPDNVIVYPGHDYLENNLRFTLSVEPDNHAAKQWLERLALEPTDVPIPTTTIGDERTFNSFFRLTNPQIRERLHCQQASDKEVFIALRARRDSW